MHTNAIQSPLEAKPWGSRNFSFVTLFETSSSLLNLSLKRWPVLRRKCDHRENLLTCLSLLQERDATSAYLETLESHMPAQRLFTSVGFTHLSI